MDDPATPAATPPDGAVPFPASLCHRCAACDYVQGRNSWFVRCAALAQKYPPQPVLRCPAFRAVGSAR